MKNSRLLFLTCFLFMAALCGCGDEAVVPIYVTINEPNVLSRPDEGTSFHSITEYFMFHRTSLLGGFSFGNEIPVLADGDEDLLVFAGIRQNSLIEQPARYEMMAPDTFSKNFTPGELINFTPTFRYYDNAKFRFIDDFQVGTVFTMDLDNDPETRLITMPDVGYGNSIGGVMTVSEEHPLLIVASQQAMNNFPLSGQVILELTFKTEVDVLVGAYAVRNFEFNEPLDKVILKPTDEWTKVYIDLGPEINSINADAFHVFFAINHALADTDQDVQTIIDDVKFVHR